MELRYTKLAGAADEMYKYQVTGLTLVDEGFDVAYKAKINQEKQEAEKRQQETQANAEKLMNN